MSVKTGCPHCGAELKLKSDKSIGRKVPCPKCSTPFVVKVLDEPAADDEYDEYSEQDYGSSYDDCEDDESSVRSSSRSASKRSSGSKRASGSGSKSRKSGSNKKRSSNVGPNWAVIGGGIAGVLVLGIAGFAFWPGGDSAATNDAATINAGDVTLGPYVSFLNDKLRLQQPSGFEVVNPPGEIVQGIDSFAGFKCAEPRLSVHITSNGAPIESMLESLAPEILERAGDKLLSKDATTNDGKTDILYSFENVKRETSSFKWIRVRGDENGMVMLQAVMPHDQQSTYSELFKEILQNAQFGPPESNAETAPATVIALAETEVNGIKLVPKKFLDGRIEMLAPAGFTLMSDEMARLKYPTANRPSEIITNETGSVNLAFTYSKQLVAPGQLGQMHASMDRMFRTVQKTAEWHSSGLKSINGRQWLELDLTMQASDTRIRNMMYGTSSGGRAALIAFNVTVEEEPQWIEAAKTMVSSMHALD